MAKHKIEQWTLKAANEIDEVLGDAVKKNTGIETGFFCGISINDIADIIIKCQDGKEELEIRKA